MKKVVLFLVLYFLAAIVCFGQTRVKTEPRAIAPKPLASAAQKKTTVNPTTEISDAEWKLLAGALAAEDWEKSLLLVSQSLNRLKIDNEKKQLAQLRYFYLYALAGKIFKSANAHKDVEEDTAREELIRAAARFMGREFVLPAREFSADCKGVVNYICSSKDGGGKLFRTTATAQNGAEIYSFDYVAFDAAMDLKSLGANKAFLGGTLQKFEVNDDLKQPWVMRLVFNKGFVRIV